MSEPKIPVLLIGYRPGWVPRKPVMLQALREKYDAQRDAQAPVMWNPQTRTTRELTRSERDAFNEELSGILSSAK